MRMGRPEVTSECQPHCERPSGELTLDAHVQRSYLTSSQPVRFALLVGYRLRRLGCGGVISRHRRDVRP
jgi:hypothetical protein